jgi:hypothetical protein
LARPAIAEYRIISYDGKRVKFWYIDHKTEQRVEADLDALDFIGKITMHIPKKSFRMVRRYGLHRRGRNEIALKAVDAYNAAHGIIAHRRPKRIWKTWKTRMTDSFGKNPLKCPLCGHEMELLYIWHRRYGYMYHLLSSSKWRKPYEQKEKESVMARRDG